MNLLDRVAVRRFLRTKKEAKRLFSHPVVMRRTLNQIEEMAAQQMNPADLKAQMDVSRTGAKGPILDSLLAFLNAHWSDILALIMKLLPK